MRASLQWSGVCLGGSGEVLEGQQPSMGGLQLPGKPSNDAGKL
jgi:hypothetical protein